MSGIRLVLSVPLLSILLCPLPAKAAEPIPPRQFSKLQALIEPGPTEWQWAKIPWMTDVWEARKKAAAEGKPLLIWAGMGHPLGVT